MNKDSQLFIYPKDPPSILSNNPMYARKMTGAFLDRGTRWGMMRKGEFVPCIGLQSLISCSCGKKVLRDKVCQFSNGFITSVFALHWLMEHQAEIPKKILRKIAKFKYPQHAPAEAKHLYDFD